MKAILTAIVLFSFAASAHADYVLAFHADGCRPCKRMEPLEKQVADEGCDIRRVDVGEKNASLAAYYGVRVYPQYVYVRSTANGDYYGGGRIVGMCTAGQLRRLCAIPVATTVGAAARNSVRAAIGCPLWEW